MRIRMLKFATIVNRRLTVLTVVKSLASLKVLSADLSSLFL